MNMPQPTTTVHNLPDGWHLCVNWLNPYSDLAHFMAQAFTEGPYPETHPRVNPNQRFVIYKSSDMEN